MTTWTHQRIGIFILTSLVTGIALGCAASGHTAPSQDAAALRDASTDAPRDPSAPAPCTLRCGSECCSVDEECAFGTCLPSCEGTLCGEDNDLCCPGGTSCVGGECIEPGPLCDVDGDCPRQQVCEPVLGRCIPIPEGATCNFVPTPGVFEPVVQWEWNLASSINTPLVVQTNDDNGDGRIDGADIPDVVALVFDRFFMSPEVFTDWRFVNTRLVALSGDTGETLWETTGPDFAELDMCVLFSPAAADLDGDGTVEIVVGASRERCVGLTRTGSEAILIVSHEGELEAVSDDVTTDAWIQGATHIADLDGDGTAEIVHRGNVFGARAELLADSEGVHFRAVADLEGDGRPELIGVDESQARTFAYDFASRSRKWETPRHENVRGSIAVARFIEGEAASGLGQVLVFGDRRYWILDGSDGSILLGPVQHDFANARAPLTVADFDGDGRPEFAAAVDDAFVVFDPLDVAEPPHVLWSRPSDDVSRGTAGSTVFDFDGDGAAEVVFSDECTLQILRGTDGVPLFVTSSTNTTFYEYPVLADVDGDGNAEMIVVADDAVTEPEILHTRCEERVAGFAGYNRGIRVYRDALDNWVPTRPIWNQHAYHVDNVQDDGRVPAREPPSWMTHNTWRLNRLPEEDVLRAPDLLIVSMSADVRRCPEAVVLRARVQNQGARGVPAGLAVAFYAGSASVSEALLGTVRTATPLLPGQFAWVELPIEDPPLDAAQTLTFHAVADDDGSGAGAHSECDETNNGAEAVTLLCGLI